MKVFNYLRVSTQEQNEERQRVAMKEFNEANGFINNVIELLDKSTGANKDRPSLQLMIKVLGEGDLVVIKSIDRLSRNYIECKELWKQIIDTGADIVVLDMPLLDTRTHKDLLGTFVSDLILQVLAYVGQQENDFRRQRQAEGIAVARAQGKHLGRPRVEITDEFVEVYKRWRSSEITAKAAYESIGMTKSTFYKLVKEYEAK